MVHLGRLAVTQPPGKNFQLTLLCKIRKEQYSSNNNPEIQMDRLIWASGLDLVLINIEKKTFYPVVIRQTALWK